MTELASPAAPGAPPDAARDANVPGSVAWLLRMLVLLTAIFVFLQAVYASLFVTGEAGMKDLHAAGAFIVVGLVLAQIVAAVLVWRPGRGPAWPIWVSVSFLVLVGFQLALGFIKLRGAHFPLGALLFGVALLMVVGTWSPRLRVRRSLPRSSGGSA